MITACSKSPELSLPCPPALGSGVSPSTAASGMAQSHRPIQVCPLPPSTRPDSAGQQFDTWVVDTKSPPVSDCVSHPIGVGEMPQDSDC